MKIDCIKTALADDIGIASTEFGCTKFYVAWLRYRLSKHRVWVHTPQTHLLGINPKTPKEKMKSRKDDVNLWRRKQKESSFG